MQDDNDKPVGADDPELLGGEDERPGLASVARSNAVAKALPIEPPPLAIGTHPPPRASYLIAMACGGLVVLLGFLGTLHLLQRTGHLPPPALSNSACLDEKLRFFRDMPPYRPTLLVVGSSVAWRGMDGAALQAAAAGVRSLNGGFCGLHVNQTQFATGWLLGHFPGVDTILMLAVPQDFTACASEPTAVFDEAAANSYAFGHAWPWKYYFEYFDPVSLARNALKISAQRANRIPLDPLVFTPTGDGPLNTTVTRSTLGDGAMPGFDPACFMALHDMAAMITGTGRHFAIVQMPLKPEWSRDYDPDNAVRDRFAAEVGAALSGTAGRRWEAAGHIALPDAAFTDAIHLRWSAVAGLSRAIGKALTAGDL